jgi:heme/copper-type cytochrome/quinol oxidase subunit 2
MVLRAAGQTDLQETSPLVWILLAISVGGAIITFAFLVYAVWKFRDPTTRGRRYG